MADPEATTGQVVADSSGATAAAPAGAQGSSVTQGQTTASGSDQGSEESFFDPKSIEHIPELKAAYKQMQAAYTKKTQGIKEHKQKIDQYDQFMSDPIGSAQQILSQLGYQVVQRDPTKKQDEPWTPNSWDDVMARAKQEVLKEMQPVFKELHQVRQQSMEARLDNSYPDWRTYEDTMVANLQKHPSLAQDPDTLYRISVPEEVHKSRALKEAMAKLKNGSESSTVSGASGTARQTAQKPAGKLTIDQAAEIARAELAKRGLHRPAG